jgi:hypothetical protein
MSCSTAASPTVRLSAQISEIPTGEASNEKTSSLEGLQGPSGELGGIPIPPETHPHWLAIGSVLKRGQEFFSLQMVHLYVQAANRHGKSGHFPEGNTRSGHLPLQDGCPQAPVGGLLVARLGTVWTTAKQR